MEDVRDSPLVQVVFEHLLVGRADGLILPPGGVTALTEAIDALFDSGEPPVPAIDALLKVLLALGPDPDSRATAHTLFKVLRGSKRVVRTLRGTPTLERVGRLGRVFKKFQGSQDTTAAPHVSATSTPAGAVKVSALLGPTSPEPARPQSRARRNADKRSGPRRRFTVE